MTSTNTGVGVGVGVGIDLHDLLKFPTTRQLLGDKKTDEINSPAHNVTNVNIYDLLKFPTTRRLLCDQMSRGLDLIGLRFRDPVFEIPDEALGKDGVLDVQDPHHSCYTWKDYVRNSVEMRVARTGLLPCRSDKLVSPALAKTLEEMTPDKSDAWIGENIIDRFGTHFVMRAEFVVQMGDPSGDVELKQDEITRRFNDPREWEMLLCGDHREAMLRHLRPLWDLVPKDNVTRLRDLIRDRFKGVNLYVPCANFTLERGVIIRPGATVDPPRT